MKSVDKSRLSDPRGPLIGLKRVAEYFGLEPVEEVGIDVGRDPRALSTSPTFKNLTEEDLPVLRRKLSRDEDPELVAAWAEKLMRYCEIRRRDLRKTAFRKWPSGSRARLLMLQIAAFLLDYYYRGRDLRYLNTALKLSDMKWIVDNGRISSGLRSSDQDEFAAGLFGLRVVMMREQVLRQLEGELVGK